MRPQRAYVTRALFVAALSSFLFLGLPVPAAVGLPLAAVVDAPADTRNWFTDATILEPRADIVAATAEWRPGGEIVLGLRLAVPTDPRTDPNWAGMTYIDWVIDVSGDDKPEYWVQLFVDETGSLLGEMGLMSSWDGSPVRVAYDLVNQYSVVLTTPFAPGDPGSIRFRAGMVYDTDPEDGDAPVVYDVAPDGEHLAGPVDRPPAPSGTQGFWLLGRDGGVFSFGAAPFFGSTGALRLNQPVVSMAATPGGGGYWFVASDGGTFNYGRAGFHGSTGGIPLNRPIVGMAPTPSGNGYWLVASDGGIFAFGDARFHGSTGGIPLNRPIVGMAPTPSGNGYWLVASDGGIFAFGDARFHGSTGAMKLNQPIVAMAASPSGEGYCFIARDGGMFTFGDAEYYGSALGGNAPVVGMAFTHDGEGYWIARADGSVVSLGESEWLGSLAGSGLNAPIVGVASAR